MQEAELHDLSDDPDYVASQQQGSGGSENQKCTRKSNGPTEPNGSEVVYSKDNVAIHPTQYASERISGRLQLIKRDLSLFMTWIPYKQSASYGVGQGSRVKLPEKDRNLYTIRAVPLTDVRSIRRHTPTLGWQYIIMVLTSGLAFPPLYFYNGGVREFLATLKQHVFLVRSADDANVFLVNDLQDPLQRSLSSLELPRAVPVANVASSSSSLASVHSDDNSNQRSNADYHDSSFSPTESVGRHRQKVRDPARDLSIQVLEKFSLVTKFARETTSHLLRESQIFDNIGGYEKQQQVHSSPVKNQVGGDPVSQELQDKNQIISDPLEKIACRNGKLCEAAATLVGTFELIDSKEAEQQSLVWGKPRLPPLGHEEWATFLDEEGRIVDSKALRKRIFYGGVEHGLRKEVWKFLLGYNEFHSTYAEREFLETMKRSEYETIKHQWQSISPAQARRFAKFKERKSLIEKDVVRTDRSIPFYDGDENPNVGLLRDILLTFSFYNFDLGYCQGMSDLLSPILFVMEDESEAFWCFVSLMERLGPNFNRDQNGMHSQLLALSKLVEFLDSPLHCYLRQADCLNFFFCFRWILIQFKREFVYEKTMRLWEVLWTHYLSEHFHLYMCVAILKKHRKKIIEERMDFDTLLKFINELSCHITLEATLKDAEALCIIAGENKAACIPPGTPPSLPVEGGLLE
ncbi:TBC1 domain family member 15 isoform X1 [Amborella trichopoda]|uniref:TBC1 domain family member 15 n=1 Tax=Amborella trichopoda TaxID=13333 RepID=U5D8E7_AMBTC|nr:TBC1 domain family member 15 isoform X1 [Amborella trichopoda]ERN16643.1 hypothetical protein AMTR_s00051p00106780 [Amborella trichopoda]|eukprot:XP_006855176.1 TBC1 domain family member 15 isoform X1 [Amborella trichopoda]